MESTFTILDEISKSNASNGIENNPIDSATDVTIDSDTETAGISVVTKITGTTHTYAKENMNTSNTRTEIDHEPQEYGLESNISVRNDWEHEYVINGEKRKDHHSNDGVNNLSEVAHPIAKDDQTSKVEVTQSPSQQCSSLQNQSQISPSLQSSTSNSPSPQTPVPHNSNPQSPMESINNQSNLSSFSGISNDSSKDFLQLWLTYLSITSPQLEKYKEILLSEAFDDFASVIELDEKDLDEFGFKRGHKRKILRWKEEMKDTMKKANFFASTGISGDTTSILGTILSSENNTVNKYETEIESAKIASVNIPNNQIKYEKSQESQQSPNESRSIYTDVSRPRSSSTVSVNTINSRHRMHYNGSRGLSNASETSDTLLYTHMSEKIMFQGIEDKSIEEKAFIQFVHTAIYLISSGQTELFISICFHPVDIASFRNLGLTINYLSEKLDAGEANCSKVEMLHLFKEILLRREECIAGVTAIHDSKDRYGGTHEYRTENGAFLFRYLNVEKSNLARRWYLCNFPR